MTLQAWYVEQAGEVKEGQVVAAIETEKTVMDVEAIGNGFIDIRLQQGGAAKPGDVIALIHDSQRAVGGGAAASIPASATATPAPPLAIPQPPAQRSSERQEATPVARLMAGENGIDLTLVTGTGPRGRVVKADVEKVVALVRSASRAAGYAAGPAHYAVTPEQIVGLTAAETHKLAGMRTAIATGMMNSLHGMAQLSGGGEWNAEGWVALRKKLLAQEVELGCRISYTAMMIYALAKALRKHPYMNASIVGHEIRVWNEINIGVAVAAGPTHLSVPVIRDADQKSLAEIAKELKALSARVRDGSISRLELAGSTFTLTSVVKSANSWATPVIHAPNAAILGTQPIKDAPVVRHGELTVGKVLPVSLTFDHRLINGAGAEEFCLTLSKYVESPELLMG
jgi:pyruvate dehydrogenase E2 component (dihydrolipoamide acetyltransferase)/2-oxoglutarate dehydrogenase E2 component (dihydrolipoamide succinyltransferase)